MFSYVTYILFRGGKDAFHCSYSLDRQQTDFSINELKATGFISQFKWSENGKNDWLIYYWPGERARKEMKDVKKEAIDFEKSGYLPGSEESLDEAGRAGTEADRLDLNNQLVGKLLDLNVSKITATRLVNKYNHEIIRDWIRALEYTNAENKAAYLVKAIKENWQLPEEYLKEKENIAEREEDRKTRNANEKVKSEESKRKQEENLKLDQIYQSFSPEKQKEIDREAENKLDDFWKAQLNKERAKDKLSKILQVALDEKKKQVVLEWVEKRKNMRH